MVERTDGMHSCLNAHAALLRDAGRVCDVVLLGNGGDCLLDGLWSGPDDASADAIATRLFGKLAIGLPPRLAADVVDPDGPLADAPARAARGLAAALASVDGDSAANRAGLNPFVARPNRRSFADYDDELRHGARALLTDVLLAAPTLDRGWWRADGVRRLVAEHLAGRANHSTGLGVVLTLELFARAVFAEERADAEPIKSTA